MKPNISTIDRVIRVLIAVIITILFFTNIISGIIGIVLLILAGVFLLTSLISFCPIYWTLGISSRKNTKIN